MTQLPLEPDSSASNLAAEGHAALGTGDTVRAARCYQEAGEVLEMRISGARKQGEKHLLRFLAASQYYHGGLYGKAEGLSRKVQADLLPPTLRHTYATFRKDAKERAAPRYKESVEAALIREWEKQRYREIIGLLQVHPYVLSRGDMAHLRGCCCEQLKNYRAAALFFADAIRFGRDSISDVVSAGSSPLVILEGENFAEAWACVEQQLAAIRHAMPNISASLLRFHQASQAPTQTEREVLSREQLGYADEAWALFQEMPPNDQAHSLMREYMALCLEVAVFAMRRLGDQAGALEFANRAVKVAPSSPSARTARGIVTYPAESAIEDFREAIRLGEGAYYPYYYLAHAAFMRDEFEQAASWAEKAREHKPSMKIEAQLLEMLAISRSHLGAAPADVESLFAKAKALDPANRRIDHNLAVFRKAVANAATAARQHWERDGLHNGWEDDRAVRQREWLLLSQRMRPNPAEPVWAAAG